MHQRLRYDPQKYPKLANECFKQHPLRSNKYYWDAKSWNTNKKLQKIIFENRDSVSEDQKIEKNLSSVAILYSRNNTEALPYLNFLRTNKKDKDLITWPSKYADQLPVERKILTVEEIADAMILKTSKDIAKLLLTLDDEYDEEIFRSTTEKIKFIFSTPEDLRSFTIKNRQLHCVPDQIADKYDCKNACKSEALKKNINLDINAERQTKKVIGFNRSLPIELQINPPNNKVEERWFMINSPKEIEDMSIVFKSITDLEITKKIYDNLKINRLPIPAYLENAFMRKRSEKEIIEEYLKQIEECPSEYTFPDKLPKLNQRPIEEIIERTLNI